MSCADFERLPTWEGLLKRILYAQLDDLQGLRILDFGSGRGFTANHFAARNDVTAVEIDRQAIANRFCEHAYTQLTGSLDVLRDMPDATFDLVLCHNVLEYMDEKAEALQTFYRLLKPGGRLSLVKHNRAGRVMQMVVLLNNFDHAQALLEGQNGTSSEYGAIRYYENADIARWCPDFEQAWVRGIRCFWDLQQNQEIQKDKTWKDRMVEMEMRVSEIPAYRDVAFFHHLMLIK